MLYKDICPSVYFGFAPLSNAVTVDVELITLLIDSCKMTDVWTDRQEVWQQWPNCSALKKTCQMVNHLWDFIVFRSQKHLNMPGWLFWWGWLWLLWHKCWDMFCKGIRSGVPTPWGWLDNLKSTKERNFSFTLINAPEWKQNHTIHSVLKEF